MQDLMHLYTKYPGLQAKVKEALLADGSAKAVLSAAVNGNNLELVVTDPITDVTGENYHKVQAAKLITVSLEGLEAKDDE